MEKSKKTKKNITGNYETDWQAVNESCVSNPTDSDTDGDDQTDSAGSTTGSDISGKDAADSLNESKDSNTSSGDTDETLQPSDEQEESTF